MKRMTFLLVFGMLGCGGGNDDGDDPVVVAGTVETEPTGSAKPATTWVPADPANYVSAGDRGIEYVVIHTIEGTVADAIAVFQNPATQKSAHYVVGYDGAVTQMVQDKDVAWHAGEFNAASIGIEHEGYANANNWTTAEYVKSAELTRWLCLTYAIPMDREHILGHSEAPGATHGDPGIYFDWVYYLALVKQENAVPSVPYKAMEVTASVLNVRTGPSTSFSIIGTVQNGQRYVAVAESGGWYRIYYKGNLGWSYGGYLTQKYNVTGIIVTADLLNVRSGPGTSYSIVGTVAKGERYVVISISNGWKRIWWGGQERWVYGSYTEDFTM
ncbi:MAG: N-acetylmuramoyl-L-alanine amidase [Planctomycetes bacterium]|nr:N-acetylmuramoyl-L-alanine amidase [Planctomycetota bacterium]